MDTELSTLRPCMHRRASQLMSRICLRRNLAALELIQLVVITFFMQPMLLRFFPLLRRDTRWPLR